MLPRVNNPSWIKTADYIWNGEKWDLKTINGNSKMTVDYLIKKQRHQSNNFVIDISNSSLAIDEIISQIKKIYNSKY